MLELMGHKERKFKPYVAQALAVLYHTSTHPSAHEITEQFLAKDLKNIQHSL